MNLKNLSNDHLHQKTIALAHEERQLTVEILHHLREISARRLYAALGYSSLWAYCLKELKYSEAAAQRRIGAMKLMAEMPEIEEKIKEGKLFLSIVSQIQSACKTKPLLKIKVLQAVEGKSTRQAEKILASFVPQIALPEKRRVLNETQTEVRFVVSEKLDQKLERIKALTAHKKYNPTYAELIEMMADFVLDKIDPERKQICIKQPLKKAPPASEVKAPSENHARYVSAYIKQAVWQRDQGQCTHETPTTKQRCQSKYGLEYDHIIPLAQGGQTIIENLRLLCHTHNQFHAIRSYGIKKMSQYVPGLVETKIQELFSEKKGMS